MQDALTAAQSPNAGKRPQPTLAARWWGLEWSKVLPWSFGDVTLENGTADEGLAFVAQHYAAIFGAPGGESRFLADPMTEAKRRFCADMDVLLFRDAGKVIGIQMAHPSDSSSYYMRTVAILPEYRERGLLTQMMDRIYAPLPAAGVERIEGDCSPANTAMVKMLVRQGFVITGQALTERWGAYVHWTKFLRADGEDVFRRQFTVFPPTRRGDINDPQTNRRTS